MPVLIVNARIATGDPRRPWVDAVVLEGTTVVEIGSSAALRKRFGAMMQVIDARGAEFESADAASVASVIEARSPEALP